MATLVVIPVCYVAWLCYLRPFLLFMNVYVTMPTGVHICDVHSHVTIVPVYYLGLFTVVMATVVMDYTLLQRFMVIGNTRLFTNMLVSSCYKFSH